MNADPADLAPTRAAPVEPPLPTAERLRAAVWACRVQFACLGMLGGAWGVHVPSAKAHFELDEAALSGLLLAAAIGAMLCLLFAGRLVARLGVRGAARITVLLVAGSLAALLVLPSFGLALVAMLLFGASSSLFDMAINAEGTAIEAISGRAVMSGLHGMFSLGGMVGAGVSAALLHAGMPPALQLASLAAAVGALAWLSARRMLDAHPASEGDEAHFAWPRGPLLLIGLLILAGMTAEGVMYDWSVLYMKQELLQPQAFAALGYMSFSAAMAATRFAGDRLRERLPQRTLLGGGAGLAAVAMAVVLLSAHPWVAIAGFAVVGAGLATVVPILYNAATLVPGTSRAAAIAAASSIGYGGFLLGPPLIGAIAHGSSLTLALGVLVLSAATLALCARFVPAAPGR
ncbi:MAG TPA: MFS transporter [Ideonella sp.]|nr:MFS transporter [Ideonella sp.]